MTPEQENDLIQCTRWFQHSMTDLMLVFGKTRIRLEMQCMRDFIQGRNYMPKRRRAREKKFKMSFLRLMSLSRKHRSGPRWLDKEHKERVLRMQYLKSRKPKKRRGL